MKIVQAAGWFYPESLGGTEVYVEGLAQRLSALGHDVIVAAPHIVSDAERRYDHHGLPVYRYPVPRSASRDEAQARTIVRGAERFHAWLRAERPDVVHFHTFVTGLGLPEVKVARAAGARVIVTTHAGSLGFLCQRGTMMRWGTHLCDGFVAPSKCAACVLQHRGVPRPLAWTCGVIPPRLGHALNGWSGKLGTALTMSDTIVHSGELQRELLETVDRFVVLTQWAYDVVVDVNGGRRDKVALNRLGYSYPVRAPKPGPDVAPTRVPVHIGCISRLDPEKGLSELVQALCLLPPDLPYDAEIRGPAQTDAERALLAALRVQAAGNPRIHFSDAVPPSEMLDRLAGYDVFCCPSIFLEGGPTVAIEAQAVGTPIVGSRLGGLSELVRDRVDGRLVPPCDVPALAEALREAIADPASTIDRWRAAIPPARTMDDVTRDYLGMYTS